MSTKGNLSENSVKKSKGGKNSCKGSRNSSLERGGPPKRTKAQHDKIIAGLDKEPWYVGLLGRNDMMELMREEGEFLIRSTEIQGDYGMALSVVHNRNIVHFAIKEKKETFAVTDHWFKNITELVNHYWKKGVPVGAGVILVKPYNKATWVLDHKQIELGKQLGAGAFGDVRLATLTTVEGKKLTVAVKTCKKKNLSKDDKDKFLKEARLNRIYTHPNIIAFIGIAADQEPLMLVLEFAPNGALLNYLRKNKTTDAQKAKFCLECALGMQYLESHAKPIIHRDLAARNCLLGPKLEVKITDFGLSRDQSTYCLSEARVVPVKWTSPETLRQGKYYLASDTWSYGVVMWEIYSDGADPYPGMPNKDVQKAVCKDLYRMPAPKGMPAKTAEIMMACWEDDYTKRPKFATIVQKMK